MRVRRLACLVVCSGALAGCSLGPEYFTPDAALPVNFVIAPTGERLLSGGAGPEQWQWWRTLHDRQLNELIELAIQNNLDLKVALDRLQQARLQRVVLGAQQLPQLNGGVGGGTGTGTDETKGRVAQALRDGNNNTGLTKITGAGGLDAEWEIDIFGKIASRIEAQVYTAEALKEARDWVYVVVAADVARLYFDLRVRQERLQILYRGIEAAKKVVDLTQNSAGSWLDQWTGRVACQARAWNSTGRRRTAQGTDRRKRLRDRRCGRRLPGKHGPPSATAWRGPAPAGTGAGRNSSRSAAPPSRRPRGRAPSRSVRRRYRCPNGGFIPKCGHHRGRGCADRSTIRFGCSNHLDRVDRTVSRGADPRFRRARCQDRDR